LDVDLSFSNERLLYYTFDNIIRTYLKSDFYRIMKKYIKKDCVFIDIAETNLGLYSLLAKQLGAYTILFEPEHVVSIFLSRNKTVFDEVYSCALGNFEG
jgi:hypothetical protein